MGADVAVPPLEKLIDLFNGNEDATIASYWRTLRKLLT